MDGWIKTPADSRDCLVKSKKHIMICPPNLFPNCKCFILIEVLQVTFSLKCQKFKWSTNSTLLHKICQSKPKGNWKVIMTQAYYTMLGLKTETRKCCIFMLNMWKLTRPFGGVYMGSTYVWYVPFIQADVHASSTVSLNI